METWKQKIWEIREFFYVSSWYQEKLQLLCQKLQQTEKIGFGIEFCRAQDSDNIATISGLHGGLINHKALFTPYSNYSLNLRSAR